MMGRIKKGKATEFICEVDANLAKWVHLMESREGKRSASFFVYIHSSQFS